MTATRTAAQRHVPVLRPRVVELLAPACAVAAPVYVDATLGMGGHAEAMLEAVPGLTVIGIDRDPAALALAAARLGRYGDQVRLVHAVYDDLGSVLDDFGVREVDAVLFDLGVSSLQLDEPDRGFAYRVDAPLDMRMDPTTGRSAAELVATASVDELTRILREYGEERFAARVARSIVAQRENRPITTSAQLVRLLTETIPTASQRSGGHPAKRTFQALRIAVNGELEAWAAALPLAVDRLRVGGRIVILSYHSLEDRLAKTVLGTASRSTTPPGLPVELPDHAPYLRLLTRGAEMADAAETAQNPRAASVRLRAAERVREGSIPR